MAADPYRNGWGPPAPPRDLNGWGQYITRAVEAASARSYQVEHRLTVVETVQAERLAIQEARWAELMRRLYHIDQSAALMRQDMQVHSPAPASTSVDTPLPSAGSIRDTVKEIGVTTKEIGAALRWVAVIVIVLAVAFKKVDIESLRAAWKLVPG